MLLASEVSRDRCDLQAPEKPLQVANKLERLCQLGCNLRCLP